MGNCRIGEIIAKLREEEGWTQQELAERAGVPERSVKKWESGAAYPEVPQLPALAKVFGVSIDYLVTGTVSFMSRTQFVERCIRLDDTSALNGWIDYEKEGGFVAKCISKYESCKLFAAICEKSREFAMKFPVAERVRMMILSNRLDLSGEVIVVKRNYCVRGEPQKVIMQLYPEEERSFIFPPQDQDLAVLPNELFRTICFDPRVSEETRAVLFGRQDIRESVWAAGFPYMIHECYAGGKYDMMDRLLALAEENNRVGFEKHNAAFEKWRKARGRYGRNESVGRTSGYTLRFHFEPMQQSTLNSMKDRFGYGIVRILEKTVRLALENGDFKSVERFNAFNSSLLPLFRPYIASDEEIELARMRHDPSVPEWEIKLRTEVRGGVLDVAAVLKYDDLDLLQKGLKKYPICQEELRLRELRDMQELVRKKKWRQVYEFALNRGDKALQDAAINGDQAGTAAAIGRMYADLNGKGIALTDEAGRKAVMNYVYLAEKGQRVQKELKPADVLEYVEGCKQRVIEDAKLKAALRKQASGLTKEYFEKELSKGNSEIVIIKLCVRLEAYLRRSGYEGDFSDMLTKYCQSIAPGGWDGSGRRGGDTASLLNRLRICRNGIVHADQAEETMTSAELRECIEYICGLPV